MSLVETIRALLAHAASAQGVSAVENFLQPDHRRPQVSPVPNPTGSGQPPNTQASAWAVFRRNHKSGN